jgi:hypothetical protein
MAGIEVDTSAVEKAARYLGLRHPVKVTTHLGHPEAERRRRRIGEAGHGPVRARASARAVDLGVDPEGPALGDQRPQPVDDKNHPRSYFFFEVRRWAARESNPEP